MKLASVVKSEQVEELSCGWCGDKFRPKKGLKRYCSPGCRAVGVRQECVAIARGPGHWVEELAAGARKG